MFSTVLVAGVSLFLMYVYKQIRALQRNIAAAKQSGLPYVLSPVYFQQIWWVILQELFLPVLRLLPVSWTESWLPLSLFGRIWHEGYEPFARMGSDTFIVVSASGNILWTCDPEAIVQFTKNHHDFIKPIKMMGMLNMYGPTITATEGEESRLYRRVAAPSFNDRTHSSVWTESLNQTAKMTAKLNTMEDPVTKLNEDLATLTLHVISYACFDRQIEWQKATPHRDSVLAGHDMSYEEAISTMLDSTGILFIIPRPLLSILPFEALKRAKMSFIEWKSYMEEMRDDTQAKLGQASPRNDRSLLESLVDAGQTSNNEPKKPSISPAAVLGNIFIFILAGHETSANTLMYAITLLACRPSLQKALQVNLDDIFGNRPSSQWSFETDFPKLLDGPVGAIMNETLRLYSVLPFLPKTTETTPKSLTIKDRSYVVPANTLIMINTSATHRNPKYWPAIVPNAADAPPYPVSSFDPFRWLQKDPKKRMNTTLFSPKPGSYIPFAEGPRACMGKRFAQAQFCAVIAKIFKEYTVELAVDSKAKGVNSESLWQNAINSAESELSKGVGFLTSLKMKGKVPLRIAKRGSEE